MRRLQDVLSFLLQWQENGFRTLSTNKPINEMSDLKGVKIRIMENKLQLQQWKDYVPAVDLDISADEERMVDALVAPGHPSTPGYTDPAYPLLPRR